MNTDFQHKGRKPAASFLEVVKKQELVGEVPDQILKQMVQKLSAFF